LPEDTGLHFDPALDSALHRLIGEELHELNAVLNVPERAKRTGTWVVCKGSKLSIWFEETLKDNKKMDIKGVSICTSVKQKHRPGLLWLACKLQGTLEIWPLPQTSQSGFF
jgi:hypothetical protein